MLPAYHARCRYLLDYLLLYLRRCLFYYATALFVDMLRTPRVTPTPPITCRHAAAPPLPPMPPLTCCHALRRCAITTHAACLIDAATLRYMPFRYAAVVAADYAIADTLKRIAPY